MALEIVYGDIFEADVDALVNPINRHAVSGKGLALQFKDRFPDNQQFLEERCAVFAMSPGGVYPWYSNDKGLWIVNAVTKDHWRNNSRIEWVTQAFDGIREFLRTTKVDSIAVPALGAGLGRLPWPQVRDEAIRILGEVPQKVLLYEP